MNKKISSITYNYHQEGNLQDGVMDCCCSAVVGKNGVEEINEIEYTEGNGLLYCVINYKCGKSIKVFNLDTITYEEECLYLDNSRLEGD